MKKLIAGVLLATTFNVNAGFFSSDTDDAMDTVREGSPDGCQYELGEMIDSAFNDGQWQAEKLKSGRLVVNIEGNVYFQDRLQHAYMQFEVKDDEFWLQTLKLDKRYQSQMMVRRFSNYLCDAVDNPPVIPEPVPQVFAKILSWEYAGEEAIEIDTDKGTFIVNGNALSSTQFGWLDRAIQVKGGLCFEGEDSKFKDNFRKKCK